MAKITITNVLTKVISDATGVEAVISPTGITKPCTPIQEYVGDMATVVNGTLLIPAYNKVQTLSIPFGAKFTFEATDAKEINYWENMKVNGAKIEVDQAAQTTDITTGLTPVNAWVFTRVSIVNTAEQGETPVYKPAFAANTFFAPAENGGEPAQDASAIANDTGWGTTVTTVYTRKKNVLPTNDKQGE